MARTSLHDIDPDLAIYDAARAGDLPAAQFAAERLRLTLSGLFATVVMALASMGLYGVLSQMVGRRTREIGTRLALGERPGRVRAAVVWTAVRLACAGIIVGSAAAVVLWRLASTAIADLDRPAPGVLTAEAIALVVVACLAGWIPARRASAIDPAAALKAE